MSPSASRPRAPVRMRSRAPRAIDDDTSRDRTSRQGPFVNNLGSSPGPAWLGWGHAAGASDGNRDGTGALSIAGGGKLAMGESPVWRPAWLVHEPFRHVDRENRHQRPSRGHEPGAGNVLRLPPQSRLPRLAWIFLR